jgi:hypothetical protein
MFSCKYALSGKSDVPVFLAKLDIPVYQTRLSDFGRQNICFFCFNCCDPLVICISYYMLTLTFVALHGCIYIPGVLSWIFLKNVQNDIFGQKLNSIQYAHT